MRVFRILSGIEFTNVAVHDLVLNHTVLLQNQRVLCAYPPRTRPSILDKGATIDISKNKNRQVTRKFLLCVERDKRTFYGNALTKKSGISRMSTGRVVTLAAAQDWDSAPV